MSKSAVVLASGSPRRSEILNRIGIPHTIVLPEVDESLTPHESIHDFVMRLAVDKYRVVEAKVNPGTWLIAADTMVELNGEWLGKPQDAEEAKRMLRRMSGQIHTVWTGVALGIAQTETITIFCERSDVEFIPLSEVEIEKYVANGEPLDKAGAYGVQGLGARYVRRIEGCFFNVMGLPVAAVYKGLEDLGWSD